MAVIEKADNGQRESQQRHPTERNASRNAPEQRETTSKHCHENKGHASSARSGEMVRASGVGLIQQAAAQHWGDGPEDKARGDG